MDVIQNELTVMETRVRDAEASKEQMKKVVSEYESAMAAMVGTSYKSNVGML